MPQRVPILLFKELLKGSSQQLTFTVKLSRYIGVFGLSKVRRSRSKAEIQGIAGSYGTIKLALGVPSGAPEKKIMVLYTSVSITEK